jgi:hypothetical protein
LRALESHEVVGFGAVIVARLLEEGHLEELLVQLHLVLLLVLLHIHQRVDHAVDDGRVDGAPCTVTATQRGVSGEDSVLDIKPLVRRASVRSKLVARKRFLLVQWVKYRQKAKYLVVRRASMHLLARQPDLVAPGKRTVLSVEPWDCYCL